MSEGKDSLNKFSIPLPTNELISSKDFFSYPNKSAVKFTLSMRSSRVYSNVPSKSKITSFFIVKIVKCFYFANIVITIVGLKSF